MQIKFANVRGDDREKALGVHFWAEPVNLSPIVAVLFEGTCGNLINLIRPLG